MNERDFYEGYFRDVGRGEQEKEKQLNRLERLRIEVAQVPRAEGGLFVGIGNGEEMRCGKGALVGLDLPFIELQKNKRIHPEHLYLCGDARTMPLKSGLFDYVVCSEVIEHVKERTRVLKELRRVLREEGTLILSTPNWWSLYGVFRWIYELVSKTMYSAGDQPIDVWGTPPCLLRECSRFFLIRRVRGSWYWPPTGKGSVQISPRLMARLFGFLRPVDLWLGRMFPWFGHSLWVIGQPSKEPSVSISDNS